MGRVHLRFQRWGRKRRAFYRLVAANPTKKRDGKYIELLGTYNPILQKDGKKIARLEVLRIKYWLSVGAQPTGAAAQLLSDAGLIPELPRRTNLKKKHIVKAQENGLDGDILDMVLGDGTKGSHIDTTGYVVVDESVIKKAEEDQDRYEMKDNEAAMAIDSSDLPFDKYEPTEEKS
mmetsp:Transcript_4234/g.5212  ORF Transcript_4234/g.5212 Transcript_4234/m.5212 type:complete len:176 (+) Transcript_4234:75-602(+)|eukprot:jgi/Bigna1/54028/estExt_Genewise1Plus.C_270126